MSDVPKFVQSRGDMGMTVEEAAAFLFRTAGEFASTKEFTQDDLGTGSCVTVRVPVAALKRLYEAINRKENA